MKERPILFQGAMVRAVLREIDPKTQTRRLVKPRRGDDSFVLVDYGDGWRPWRSDDGESNVLADGTEQRIECPYGYAGDRLWVRETFLAFGRWETRFSAKKGRDEWHFIDMTAECGNWYFYAATNEPDRVASFRRDSGVTPMWWKRPGIFMPRAASRILLEVTGVRVERLQDISKADAIAEGIERREGPDPCCWRVYGQADVWTSDPVHSYCSLWCLINGFDSWNANPWVWIVEFKRFTL